MTQVQLSDRAPLMGVRKTDDGYLVADARVARTGIQEYNRSELGLVGDGVVRVYRPEEEVFKQDALHTYAYRPLTMGHPSVPVTSDNWKDLSIGQTGGEVARDGEYIRVPMVVMDGAAIKSIEDGKRELSMGYMSEIEFKDGITPDGQPYDAIQRNLRMNHLAVVAKARGGSKLKIGDDQPKKGNAMSDGTKLRTVIVDGLSVETTDAGAQAIEKLQKDLKDAQTAATDTAAEHDRAIAAKDAEIEDLKGKIIEDKDLDAMVANRAKLISDAKKIAGEDIDPTGLSAAQIRKAAVVARLGDARIEGKSEAYVEAMFDALLDAPETKKSDSFADGVKSGVKTHDGEGGWDKAFASTGIKMKKEG